MKTEGLMREKKINQISMLGRRKKNDHPAENSLQAYDGRSIIRNII